MTTISEAQRVMIELQEQAQFALEQWQKTHHPIDYQIFTTLALAKLTAQERWIALYCGNLAHGHDEDNEA